MTLKGWMLGKVNESAKRGARARNPRIAPTLHGDPPVQAEPALHDAPRASRRRPDEDVAHLGPYGVLIGAIREELERFVTTQLRLHLAIAERDRFVLTSIEVECEDDDEHAELLRRFVREFRPEQIKRYLARDVVAGLRNASAIDLSQFAGLNAARPLPEDAEKDGYAELLAELQAGADAHGAPPYRVTLLGRWSAVDVAAPSPGIAAAAPARSGPATPLSGTTCPIELDDAAGPRRVELASIVPGRRYVVGKDDACDVVVDGVYASRRHCEIWLDGGTWWAADARSTNGIRVEWNGRVTRRGAAAGSDGPGAVEIPAGAALILSAHAVGDASHYPRLVLQRAASGQDARSTGAPATPVAPALSRQRAWKLSARMAAGTRETELTADELPFAIGRSRNQSLAVDWSHAAVSGRHVEIVALDDAGATLVVHGDNGVLVDGEARPAGARFTWRPGEELVLGARADADACTLTLVAP